MYIFLFLFIFSQLNASHDVALYSIAKGRGKPIVVVHGGPGLSHDYLLPSFEQLAKNHRVILYDQRGCGRSQSNICDETITLANFVEDIESIRKEYNLEKITLLGHSWGGFVAMHYAIAHPDKLDALILSNSMPATSDDFMLFLHQYLQFTQPFRQEISSIEKSQEYKCGSSDMVEKYFRLIFRTYCYKPEKAEQLLLKMPTQCALNGRKVYEIFADTVFRKPFNLHDALQKLKVKTLIVHGEYDVVPEIGIERIHNSISGSQYVLMKECGHFPFVEEPEKYFKTLNDFLQ